MRRILNFNAVLFRAIENRALSWDNWDKIEQFHVRHLSSLTVAAATASVAAPVDGGDAQNVPKNASIKTKKDESEALRKAMVAQHICFKFNRGKCDQEEDHDSNGNGLTLLHACGKCSKENRGIVKTHGVQECKPNFQIFLVPAPHQESW